MSLNEKPYAVYVTVKCSLSQKALNSFNIKEVASLVKNNDLSIRNSLQILTLRRRSSPRRPCLFAGV